LDRLAVVVSDGGLPRECTPRGGSLDVSQVHLVLSPTRHDRPSRSGRRGCSGAHPTSGSDAPAVRRTGGSDAPAGLTHRRV
jgi:hypothetical protein